MPDCLGQPHGFVLQAEAMDFDAEQEHGLPRVFDSLHRFIDRFGQRPRVAVGLPSCL